jgi:predicted nuclease of predicted toxin-antitoxin system
VAVKYLLDADFPRALFTGLRREDSGIDVVRVQQVGLREASDAEILAFAAAEGRMVVTKDKATMRDFAAERIKTGERMPGLLVVRPS